MSKKIRKSSTAEYFAENLQQVGFSSLYKAVLTTLKEAVDNALDACEDHGILPDIEVLIEKKGEGSLKNSDRLLIRVVDNGRAAQSLNHVGRGTQQARTLARQLKGHFKRTQQNPHGVCTELRWPVD